MSAKRQIADRWANAAESCLELVQECSTVFRQCAQGEEITAETLERLSSKHNAALRRIRRLRVPAAGGRQYEYNLRTRANANKRIALANLLKAPAFLEKASAVHKELLKNPPRTSFARNCKVGQIVDRVKRISLAATESAQYLTVVAIDWRIE